MDWESPKGKSIFYNDRLGLLFIRATAQDLDTIEAVIGALNQVTPEVHIKARFLAVPKGTLDGLGGFYKALGNTNDITGILSPTNARIALRALESSKGSELLASPEVVTLSGRQTEMRATTIQTIVTNFSYRETPTNSEVVPQTGEVETGPVLDTIATVLDDGYTIDLSAMPSVTEFLGYDQPTNTAFVYNSAGEKIKLPTVLPAFCVRKASAHVRLWDGQTVVLGNLKKLFYDGEKEASTEPDYFVKEDRARGRPNEEDKEVLVFITVIVVDPAGNRIHSDSEMPFAKDAIPPQDDQ